MKTLILLLAVISLSSCQSQINTDNRKTLQFERQVDSLRIAYKIPGMSVGISIQDSIQFIKGFGWANVEQKVPMTGDTPLRIASLTKPIFSTLFMHLMEK